MQCRVCNTPYMTAPGIGPYCPDMECASHIGKPDRELDTIDEFEMRRRRRDGKVFAGMPDTALLKLRALCLADCRRTEAIWRVIKV